jgi:hypothetical protein
MGRATWRVHNYRALLRLLVSKAKPLLVALTERASSVIRLKEPVSQV